MNLGNLVKGLLHKTKVLTIKNISHLLMALGTSWSISAVILAAKMSPIVVDAVNDAIIKKTARALGMDEQEVAEHIANGHVIELEKLTIWELLSIYARYYGWAAAAELLALICIWSAHGIDIHRQVVLAGIASTAEEALHTYQRKVQDLMGKKVDKEVHNAIAQDEIDKLPPPSNTVILSGETDLWWIIDGQYFASTWLKIKDAEIEANRKMIRDMYISKQELYWLLDPERKYLKPDTDDGQIGWNVDNKLVLELDWGTDPNHKPVGIIKYRDENGFDNPPQAGFSVMY